MQKVTKKIIFFISCLILILLTACETIERKLELPDKKTLVPVINTVDLKILWDKKFIALSKEDGLNSALLLSKQDEKLFIADTKGSVVSTDTKGNIVWKNNIKEQITAGPKIFKQKVYVATANAKLICLSADTGKILWHTHLSSETVADFNFITNGQTDIILVHTIDGALNAINLINGKQSWRFSTVVPGIALRKGSTPMISGNIVVIGFANGKLFALNKDDASLLWTYNISNPKGKLDLQRMVDISADPVIKNNTVYAVSYQGNLAAIDLHDGSLVWEKEISSYNGIDIYDNTLYIVAKDGRIFAIDINNGNIIWAQEELIGRILSKPIVTNEHVIVTDLDGNLHFIGKRFGQIKSRLLIDQSGISVTPVIDQKNHILYLTTNSGRLVAVSYVTGSYNNR